MKLVKLCLAITAILITVDLYAATITITRPSGTGNDAQAQNSCDAIAATLNSNYFNKIGELSDLSRGFANTNAAMHQNASMMSYQNYDLFAVMVGLQFGLAPANSTTAASNNLKDVTSKGDAYAGVATGGVVINAGINAGFLMDGLYLSAKIGGFDYKQTSSKVDINYKQFLIGVGANYRYLDGFNLAHGFIQWRGISLGTGIVYVSEDTTVGIKNIPDQYSNAGGIPINVTGIAANLAIKSSAIVIPFDVSTSIQTLWIANLGIGAGVDLIIPESKINVGGGASVNTTGVQSAPGSISVSAVDTTSKAKFTDMLAPRLNASIGMNIAIVKLDVPLSYYPLSKTATLGITAGIVW
jgi:hypothetical protein